MKHPSFAYNNALRFFRRMILTSGLPAFPAEHKPGLRRRPAVLAVLFFLLSGLPAGYGQVAGVYYDYKIKQIYHANAGCSEDEENEYTAKYYFSDNASPTIASTCFTINCNFGCTHYVEPVNYPNGVLGMSKNNAAYYFSIDGDAWEDDIEGRCDFDPTIGLVFGDDCRTLLSTNFAFRETAEPMPPQNYTLSGYLVPASTAYHQTKISYNWRYQFFSGADTLVTPPCHGGYANATTNNGYNFIPSWQVNLEGGKTYEFETYVGPNTYLRLYGPDGYTLLAEDNDLGYLGGGLSKLIYTAAGTGIYFLECSMWTAANPRAPLSSPVSLQYKKVINQTHFITACAPARQLDLTANCSLLVPNLVTETTAIDNCGLPVPVSQSPAAGTLLSSGHNQTHTVTMTATTAAGSTKTCYVVLTGKDINNPVITVCPGGQNVNLGASCGLAVPDLVAQTTATDNCAGVTITQLPLTGAVLPSAHNQTHIVTLRATDAAGRTATCTTTLTAKDVTNPAITVCPAAQNVNLNTSCEIVVPNLLPLTTATDNCTRTLTQSPAAGMVLASAHNQTHNVNITATDAAGNAVSCTTILTAKDVTNPTITCQAHNIELDQNCGLQVPNLVEQTAAADNCTVALMVQTPAAFALLPSSHNQTHSVTLTAIDAAGNAISCVTVLTAKDVIDPVITVCPAAQNVHLNVDCGLTIPDLVVQTTATDNCAGVTITQLPLAGAVLPSAHNQTHIVTLRATDAAGRTTTCTTTLTAKDVTNPAITVCPAAQNVNLNTSCEIVVPNLLPLTTATDNCTRTLTQSPAAGMVLASAHNQTHNVSITATDAAGNAVSCTTVLTAKDITNPVIVNCPAAQEIELNTSCGLVVPNLAEQTTATDNCTVMVTQLPGAFTELSSSHNLSHYVTLTATDAAGNTATCTTMLTGNDVTAPTISCPSDIVSYNDPGQCEAVISYTAVTAGDNCSYTLTQTSGIESDEVFPFGTTVNTWEVTDEAGNTASCSFTVEVQKSGDPDLRYAYTVISFKDLSMKRNTVQSGGVGVVNAGYTANLQQNTMVTAPNTFVKAPVLTLQGGSQATTYYQGQVVAGLLPAFQPNDNPGNNNVTIAANSAPVTLTLDNYGNISVGANVTVMFSGHVTVKVKNLALGNGVTLLFDQPTTVLIDRELALGQNADLNPGGGQAVEIFVEREITIEKGTDVTANLYTQKTLTLKKAAAGTPTYMNGLFIADLVVSDEYVYWNWDAAYCPAGNQNRDAGGHFVENPGISGILRLFPNPATDDVQVSFDWEAAGEATLQLFDATGRPARMEQFTVLEGANQYRLGLAGLPGGLYTIQVVSGEQKAVEKLVIVRQ